MDQKIKDLIEERNVIIVMKFGSHLYGLDTPKSDTDYKGIFVPTAEEILLQKVPKSINITPKKVAQGVKNTAEDVDIELYSLQYFLELCLKGETVGVDMLHCNQKNIIYSKSLWKTIQKQRSNFYCTNLSMLVDYCRKQAAKYGCKGSRISDARKVLGVLKQENRESIKMGDIWDKLPKGEHIQFVSGKKEGEIHYQVCGKKLQKTAGVGYCIEILEKFIVSYGHRALLAEKNQGIDWKAVSHAIRYAHQLEELFRTGDIKFPLKDRDFILQVKKGELDYKSIVAPYLDDIISQVEALASTSDFPKKVNRNPWDKLVIDYYNYIIRNYY